MFSVSHFSRFSAPSRGRSALRVEKVVTRERSSPSLEAKVKPETAPTSGYNFRERALVQLHPHHLAAVLYQTRPTIVIYS
jgi:hypothetical protein